MLGKLWKCFVLLSLTCLFLKKKEIKEEGGKKKKEKRRFTSALNTFLNIRWGRI